MSLACTDNIPASLRMVLDIYFNISKLDLYTSEHFVNIFINNLRQGSYSVLPKDGRYVIHEPRSSVMTPGT